MLVRRGGTQDSLRQGNFTLPLFLSRSPPLLFSYFIHHKKGRLSGTQILSLKLASIIDAFGSQ
jgi:hypothetical protein